jgi:hypothetical protein
MPGLFDDLPSVGAQAAPSAGLFDDIPDAAKSPLDGIDFARPIEELRPEIAKLPEDQRKAALDKWADAETARITKAAGAPMPSPMRGSAIGTFLDEASAGLNAAGNYVTGGMIGNNYDEALALQRARDRATEAAHPTASTVANIAGAVGTAAATPMLRVAQGTGALATAANMGATGAAYGGLSGFGAGEGGVGDRLAKAGEGAAVGAAVGAPLGAAVGRFVGRGAPGAADDIARAAEQAGVDLPRAAATGDGIAGWAVRQSAGALKNVPIVGAPLVKASTKALDQMESSAGRIAEGYASAASPVTAGDSAKAAISNWIKGDSAKMTEDLYKGVGAHIPANATRPLRATQEAFEQLGVEDIRSASTVNKTAADMVKEAISRPGGLSFDGLLKLRTNVGAMLEDSMLPNAGTNKPALKRVYEGLSKDLEAMAFSKGGAPAVKAWQEATRASKIINQEREALTKIVGKDGMRSPEATLDTLLRMAGTRSTADITKLKLARRVINDDAWDEVASAAIHRLGRNQGNEFSPAHFLKNYSALSDDAATTLFGSTGKGNMKGELDALAKVTAKFKDLESMGNPSGTGRVGSLLAMVGTLATLGPLALLAKMFTGYRVAKFMASPVKVKEITRFSEAVYKAATSPTGHVTLQPAITNLARALAEDGEDERDVASRINAAMRGN